MLRILCKTALSKRRDSICFVCSNETASCRTQGRRAIFLPGASPRANLRRRRLDPDLHPPPDECRSRDVSKRRPSIVPGYFPNSPPSLSPETAAGGERAEEKHPRRRRRLQQCRQRRRQTPQTFQAAEVVRLSRRRLCRRASDVHARCSCPHLFSWWQKKSSSSNAESTSVIEVETKIAMNMDTAEQVQPAESSSEGMEMWALKQRDERIPLPQMLSRLVQLMLRPRLP